MPHPQECRWSETNPTRTELEDVGISFKHREPLDNNGLEEMEKYQSLDSRVTFLSTFPVSVFVRPRIEMAARFVFLV